MIIKITENFLGLLLGGYMGSATFHERRKQTSLTVEHDRRNGDRRRNQTAVPSNKRRLAAHVRLHERLNFDIPIRLKLRDKEVRGHTGNISQDGLLLICDTVVEVGTPLTLQFSFGEDFCYMNVMGQVVFCVPSVNGLAHQHALGIKFSSIKTWEQKVLSSIAVEIKQNGFVQKESLLSITASNKSDQVISDQSGFQQKSKRKGGFTPDPPWVLEMDRYLGSYRKAILDCRLITDADNGMLSLKQMRAWIIQLYPFIEAFPQWLALNIAKAPDLHSRGFLIDNVKVEKRHAEQWVHMARGFGIEPDEIYNVDVLPAVESLTHWMWSINTRGTLVEGVSATTYAIEGITQGIAKKAIAILPRYDGQDSVTVNDKTMWWMREHAKYDDSHPLEALEIIKLHTHARDLQEKVKQAAQRSLEYLYMALDACYTDFKSDAK